MYNENVILHTLLIVTLASIIQVLLLILIAYFTFNIVIDSIEKRISNTIKTSIDKEMKAFKSEYKSIAMSTAKSAVSNISKTKPTIKKEFKKLF